MKNSPWRVVVLVLLIVFGLLQAIGLAFLLLVTIALSFWSGSQIGPLEAFVIWLLSCIVLSLPAVFFGIGSALTTKHERASKVLSIIGIALGVIALVVSIIILIGMASVYAPSPELPLSPPQHLP